MRPRVLGLIAAAPAQRDDVGNVWDGPARALLADMAIAANALPAILRVSARDLSGGGGAEPLVSLLVATRSMLLGHRRCSEPAVS